MEFLVISGLSGAGKSQAADILEDLNYYCVDNMPVALIPKFAELCLATRGRYERVALVTDIRSRDGFGELFKALEGLWDLGCDYRILFVEADVETIVNRYKQTRRRHPLTPDGGSIQDAVKKEIVMLSDVRERADYVVNTTGLTIGMLGNELQRIFSGEADYPGMTVSVMSFGFKYGIPIEADLVFDVRFLPNPFYVAELREKCGLDNEVSEFVFKHSDSQEFMTRLTGLTDFLLPLYAEEGKRSLTIAIGCTGGRHRSVAIARALADFIESLDMRARLINRDVDKG